jgi:hypothetical protein
MCGRQGVNVPPGNVVAVIQSPITIGGMHTAAPRPKDAIPKGPEAPSPAAGGDGSDLVPSVTG